MKSLLAEFNGRCSPPWTEKQLRHKLTDARRAAGGQVRQWHRRPSAPPAVRMVWKAAPRPMAKLAKVKTVASPEPPQVAPVHKTAAPSPPLAPERRLPTMPDFADLRPDAPHLAGWHRNGTPIFQGSGAEWREHFAAESENP
jgi:hypothetical protein